MKHTKTILVCLLATGLLTACNKKKPEEAGAPASAAGAETPQKVVTSADQSLTQNPAAPEEMVTAPGVAIDEAMPPMDEGAAAPKVLAQGALKQTESEIAISGTATLYDDGFGTRLLRIEDLRSPAGFSMELGFVPFDNPTTVKDMKGRVVIGALKGASGNMNYLIGREVDLGDMRSLVLYQPGTPPQLMATIAGMLPAKK